MLASLLWPLVGTAALVAGWFTWDMCWLEPRVIKPHQRNNHEWMGIRGERITSMYNSLVHASITALMSLTLMWYFHADMWQGGLINGFLHEHNSARFWVECLVTWMRAYFIRDIVSILVDPPVRWFITAHHTIAITLTTLHLFWPDNYFGLTLILAATEASTPVADIIFFINNHGLPRPKSPHVLKGLSILFGVCWMVFRVGGCSYLVWDLLAWEGPLPHGYALIPRLGCTAGALFYLVFNYAHAFFGGKASVWKNLLGLRLRVYGKDF